MRWWWFGPSVTKPELARELEQMKQAGIGGVEVQPVYPLALDNPATGFHNFPYLSDEFIGDLRFAAVKARELGLRMDVTLGSGWPYGGPHIPVTQAAGALRVATVPVPLGAHSIPAPDIGAGEKLLAAFLAPGELKNFRAADSQRDSEIEDGRLLLPGEMPGLHVVLFFIASRTGMMVKRPAIGAEGFVLDHFDRAAIANHLHTVGERLLEAFGDRPPFAVFSDSLEVYASDWTGDLLEQFRARRGYDLTPYLPALAGDIGPQTAAIRHDWGRTLTELIDERYLTPLREWAAAHGTRFRSQTYGIPAVTLSSNALVDLPEGEGFQWRQFSYTRWATSGSHLYGRPVTSSETWTWLHSPAFRAAPLDLKAEADEFFLQGVNQIVGHGWPYSPESAGEPGWRFYAAGAFNAHNPWWFAMPEVTRYLQRCSFVLRQGRAANDVAVLLPTDDAWARFTPGHASVSDLMGELLGPALIPQILDAGFNFDFIDAEAIGKVGIPYRVLVLPGIERIPADVYRKIEDFAARGGIIIATRRVPSLAPGLREQDTDAPQIREISARLFQSASAAGHFVEDDSHLGATVARMVTPDVVFSPSPSPIGFYHRALPGLDIYFLANTSNHAVHVRANFRAATASAEWWDPVSGSVAPAAVGDTEDIEFQAYESRVLVFARDATRGISARPAAPPAITALQTLQDWSKDWNVTFSGLHRTVRMDATRSWTDDAATRFYSGMAVYEKTVIFPAATTLHGVHYYLNFGEGTVVEPPARPGRNRAWLESPVREAALIFVNGGLAGVIWRPPYEVDVTSLLRDGENDLKVVVGNLAINRMAGQAPPDYRLLDLRYGQRFTPEDMQGLEPLPAGLLGGVRLVTH